MSVLSQLFRQSPGYVFKFRNIAVMSGVHLYNNSHVDCEKICTPGLDFRGGELEEFARLATLFSIFD